MDKKLRTPIAAIMFVIIPLLSFFEYTDISAALFHYKVVSFRFWGFASDVICLALGFTLFAKKRDNILCIVLGCSTLIKFVNLILYFNIFNLLCFVVYALLLIFALAYCEQTLIKTDMSKIKELAGKLFFLPALIFLALNIFYWINIRIKDPDPYFSLPFLNILSNLLYCIAFFTLAKWLKDPYVTPKVVHNTTNGSTVAKDEYDEAYCSLGKHIVLCLFTFGIWYLIWTYRTTKYLNKAPNAIQYNPTSKLLLCIFIPFYQIYWFYKHGQRLDAMSQQKKLNNSDMSTLCLILGIFIPVVACILMQDRINVLCTTKAVAEEQKTEDSTIYQLSKYKELLDNGVITQEEFDVKKKQLLGI